jgi:hypothetical protein
MSEDKMAAIDEIHYMGANETVRLEHSPLVVGSFVSNVPVTVNYKEGKMTSMHLGYYTPDKDGKFDVIVSYLYYAS